MDTSITDQYEALFFAQSCGFLALLFNEKPTEQLVVHLRESRPPIRAALAGQESRNSLMQGAELMLQYLDRTKEKTTGEVALDLAVDWTRIFRGVAPDYSPPPPYEALYTGDGSQENHARVFLDMTREYSGLGLYTKGSYSRPDYLGIQLAYLNHLCCEEIRCSQEGKREEAQKFRDRYLKFAAEHPGRWVLPFCRRARTFARTDFYRGVLTYLPEFVQLRSAATLAE